ncbi:MAG: hypothetical protein Q4D07_06905 [Selenomonadaceae bacterium]|nr:hypothetical protein [Selenomonadaceae bacterium]
MKLWNAAIDIDSPDGIIFFQELLFEVPDDLYEKALSSLRKDGKLPKDVEEELLRLAQADFNLDDFDLYPEEYPQREEYASNEEYEKTLNEYYGKVIEYRDKCVIENICVNEIGDFLQLQLDYVGKKIDDTAEDDDSDAETWLKPEIAFYDEAGNLNIIKLTYCEDRDGKITYIDEPSACIYINDSENGTARRKSQATDYGRVREFFANLVDSYESDN